MTYHNKRSGFTLAEVLITLGIIGIVAAMTMPSLIQKYKDRELIVRTKRVYSNFQNAVILATKDAGGDGDYSLIFDPTKTVDEVVENFAKYFNGAKVCRYSISDGCSSYYYDTKYATRKIDEETGMTTASQARIPSIILNDSSIIRINQMSACERILTSCVVDSDGNCAKDEDGNTTDKTYTSYACAYIIIDVNGNKAPNQFGRDTYQLIVEKNKIVFNNSNSLGGKSIQNILSGVDTLEYTNYNVGESK